MSPQTGSVVTEWPLDDVAVVRLLGEHGYATSPDIHEAIGTALERARGVVVDLSATSYLDSSCLHTLLTSLEAAKQTDRGFTLELPTEAVVVRLFEITGLLDAFPVAETRDEAIGLTRQPRQP